MRISFSCRLSLLSVVIVVVGWPTWWSFAPKPASGPNGARVDVISDEVRLKRREQPRAEIATTGFLPGFLASVSSLVGNVRCAGRFTPVAVSRPACAASLVTCYKSSIGISQSALCLIWPRPNTHRRGATLTRSQRRCREERMANAELDRRPWRADASPCAKARSRDVTPRHPFVGATPHQRLSAMTSAAFDAKLRPGGDNKGEAFDAKR